MQPVVTYEWLSSALTKLVRGDFPAGLAGTLRDAETGWLIQFAELGVALLLIAAALSGRQLLTGIAAGTGAFLTLNFGLADGQHFFRVIAGDSFDEGLPLDVLATWLQLALLLWALAPLTSLLSVARLDARRAA